MTKRRPEYLCSTTHHCLIDYSHEAGFVLPEIFQNLPAYLCQKQRFQLWSILIKPYLYCEHILKCYLEVIHNVIYTLNSSLRNPKAPKRCFTLARNHQQCMPTGPEMGQEPGTNDFGSNGLINTPHCWVSTVLKLRHLMLHLPTSD